MSTTPTIGEIASDQRDALGALARGARLPDVAARFSLSGEEVLELARQGMTALAGEVSDDLSAEDRAIVGDYLLGCQSPGQAEGTWRLLESSPDAVRWAERVREALADAGFDKPPPLPSDDGALSPTERARRSRSSVRDGQGTLRERREERSRRRTAANAQQAAVEIASPFRSEAIAALQQTDDRIELPRWAPRPAQLAMYAVLVALLVGLGFAIFVRIPVNTNAVVLVTDIPAASPGTVGGGLQIIALFPQGTGQSKSTGADVEVGDVLRVALPGEPNRTPMRLRWVSDGPQSPRSIVDDYVLPVGQANSVPAPAHVALAPLDPPRGKTPKSYEGTTTVDASVQTGSRRIISLLFG